MDKLENTFTQIVDGLNIDVSVNREHKETLRQQMLAAYQEPSSKPTRKIQPVWSKIMKSNILKTAAAAVILLAAYILLTQTNGTGLVLANVIEQFSHPYQCTETVFYGGKEHQRIKLYRLNLSQRREERDNNEVFIVDMQQSPVRTLYLYNNDKFAKVTNDYEMGPRKDPDLLQILANMEDGNAQELGIQEINGVQVEGFRTANEYNDITIWADIQTGLPVKVEIIHLNHDRKIVFEDFAFDVQLDPSLFSTEPPKEYRVHEYDLNQNTDAEKSGQTDNTIQTDKMPGDFKPYSCEETVYRDGKKIYTSKLCRKNLSVRREERDDGVILIFDMTEKPIKFLTMKPESMTAELELHYELSPSRDPDILAMLAQMQQGFAEKLGIQQIEGIQAEGFRRVDPYNDITLWADVKTGLPVKIEILHPKQNQKIVMHNFDFETVLDDSLFLTTPPEGYVLNEKHVGLDLKASTVTKEQIQQTTEYPVYILKGELSWALKPTIVEGNVPGLSDKKLHVIAATNKDGRHVVLCQCSFYKMLKEKIRGGNKCLELNGFTAWNGGPEKWYSQIALESAEGMIPPGVSEDRTGYAIETPADTIIIVGINGKLTEDELKEMVENLELCTVLK